MLPVVIKYVNDSSKKQLVKKDLLKEKQKGEIQRTSDDSGPAATSSDTPSVLNEELSKSFDNISLFDFF